MLIAGLVREACVGQPRPTYVTCARCSTCCGKKVRPSVKEVRAEGDRKHMALEARPRGGARRRRDGAVLRAIPVANATLRAAGRDPICAASQSRRPST